MYIHIQIGCRSGLLQRSGSPKANPTAKLMEGEARGGDKALFVCFRGLTLVQLPRFVWADLVNSGLLQLKVEPAT